MVSNLEQIAIQILTEEAGVTDVKVHSEPGYCVLDGGECETKVHIRYSYPQWVMARVGRGSSTRKRLGPELVRAALRRARKNNEALARATSLIHHDGRFTPVNGYLSNSVYLRLSDDPHDARFRVQVTLRGSSLVVTGNTSWDEPLAREVESILQGR